jgi:hypothetical protein
VSLVVLMGRVQGQSRGPARDHVRACGLGPPEPAAEAGQLDVVNADHHAWDMQFELQPQPVITHVITLASPKGASGRS